MLPKTVLPSHVGGALYLAEVLLHAAHRISSNELFAVTLQQPKSTEAACFASSQKKMKSKQDCGPAHKRSISQGN